MKEEIKSILKEIRSIEKSKLYLKELDERREEYEVKLRKLENQIERHLWEIEQLNRFSFKSIVLKIKGKNQEELELSKQYYYNAALKYNETSKLLEKIDFESGILLERAKKLSGWRNRLKKILLNNDIGLKSVKLIEYKKLIAEIEKRIGFVQEIEEAIDVGVNLNKRFNLVLKFIERKSEGLYKMLEDEERVLSYNISQLDKYQDYMAGIKHEMLKFESELDDVYNFAKKERSNGNELGNNFVNEYRINLMSDIEANQEIKSSYHFLKNYKSIIMGLTKALRRDLKKVNVEIEKLEIKENKLLKNI